jgi:hypothetical protein
MTGEEIRERIIASRREAGLADHVVDPLLDQLAREVLEQAEKIKEAAA